MVYQRIPLTSLPILVALLWITVYHVEGKYESSVRDAKLRYEDIVVLHNQMRAYPSRKYNDLEILGFVTPWNAKGSQVAIREAQNGRLDIASTVTWQMHPNGLVGGQDFDASFYKKISRAGSRNYPRLLFEGSAWSISAFREVAINPKPMIDSMANLCFKHKYSGVVLELWQTLISSKAMEYNSEEMLQMIVDLGEGLRKENLYTVLVLPPYLGPMKQHSVSKESIQKLSMGFSNFIVMTYDYSVPGQTKAGPISPLNWVIEVAKFFVIDCELRGKVLLGMNFYGADFVRTPSADVKDKHVTGQELVALLREHTPDLRWMDEWGEHAFSYDAPEEHIVFYPSRKSVQLRLAIAQAIGAGGVAIWELGQGLDYFFDEF